MPYRIRLTYANRNRTCVGKVRDISFDGLFLQTPLALAVGDQIDMNFPPPARRTRTNAAIAGEIRHTSPRGVGIWLIPFAKL